MSFCVHFDVSLLTFYFPYVPQKPILKAKTKKNMKINEFLKSALLTKNYILTIINVIVICTYADSFLSYNITEIML